MTYVLFYFIVIVYLFFGFVYFREILNTLRQKWFAKIGHVVATAICSWVAHVWVGNAFVGYAAFTVIVFGAQLDMHIGEWLLRGTGSTRTKLIFAIRSFWWAEEIYIDPWVNLLGYGIVRWLT